MPACRTMPRFAISNTLIAIDSSCMKPSPPDASLANRNSTDAGKLFSERDRDDSAGSDRSAEDDESIRVVDHAADDGGVTPQGVGTHGLKNDFFRIVGNDRDQFSFVGDQQRIQPEKFAGGEHARGDRNLAVVQLDAAFRRL